MATCDTVASVKQHDVIINNNNFDYTLHDMCRLASMSYSHGSFEKPGDEAMTLILVIYSLLDLFVCNDAETFNFLVIILVFS